MQLSSRSKSTNTIKMNINDLPETLLVEILGRLGYQYLVAQCQLVCKRWWKLTSEPNFVQRCLCFRLDSTCEAYGTTLLKQTLISQQREQIHTWPTFHCFTSSPLLNPIFTRLMNHYSLEHEPVVVATYNDLVLCCTTRYYQSDYFICNPHTMDWVALPPTSTIFYDVPVGFICNSHFIHYHENGNNKVDYDLSINADYKCKVVRILPLVVDDTPCKCKWGFTKSMDKTTTFKVEIFSFETGEWRETTISSPRDFNFNQISSDMSFVYNGVLYWPSATNTANFLIGLDPFMIGDNYNKCSFIDLMMVPINNEPIYRTTLTRIYHIQCVSVLGGYVRMCSLDFYKLSLVVWDLEEGEVENARTLHVKHAVALPINQLGYYDMVELIAFDPYDEDILYARGMYYNGNRSNNPVKDKEFIIHFNFRTGDIALTRMTVEDDESQEKYCFFPLNLDPWWATPLPKLPLNTLAQ